MLYGDTFEFSGEVEEGGAGLVVFVLARPHGSSRFRELARVRTTAGGRWRYRARPTVRTVYRARVGRLASRAVAVDVEPRIVLRGANGRFTARVRAARTFAGRHVLLQQRTGRRWSTVRRLVLDRRSSTTFAVPRPRGRTQIRLVMPRSQVGPGYVTALSAVITLHRG